MKLSKYLPYALLAIVIVIFIVREMFHSKYNMKEALKLQSERNKSAYAAKQIQESKQMQLQYIQERDQAEGLATVLHQDVQRLNLFISDYKAKLRIYENQDSYNINRLTDMQLDSMLRARFPQPDSVVFSGEKAGGVQP